MSRVAGVVGVLPPYRYDQPQITEAFAGMIGVRGTERAVLQRIHANAGVSQRYLSLPLERYAALRDFGEANDVFLATAVDLGAQAVLNAVKVAGLALSDVDVLASTTITGLAVPSLDARVAARLGLREDVKRLPLVGLGCVAGAAGLARLHDHLLGHPGDVAVLLSVELCSLTMQRGDASRANLVASSLFGDGAAAVVLLGDSHPLQAGTPVRLAATRSRLYPDSERAMGWDVGASGLKIVLGVEVPDLVRTHLRADVDAFLATHGLARSDVEWWVAHPGGPKVLEAMAGALEVDQDALGITWQSLDRIGNLSSASVLHVLADTLDQRPPRPSSWGMILAMGPGFCLEMVLARAGDGMPG